MTGMSAQAVHATVFADPFSYCAHPHLAVTAAGTWLAVFNRAPRRAVVLHPPQDPEYRNVLVRSHDEGRTWSAPSVVPSYDFSGIECAGLTALRDGRVLLSQWRFGWVPAPEGKVPSWPPGSPSLRAQRSNPASLSGAASLDCFVADAPRNDGGAADFVPASRLMVGLVQSTEIGHFAGGSQADLTKAFPWARGPGKTFVHVSDDDGLSFAIGAPIDTAPYPGGYGMRGAVELPSGELVLPLSDVPHYRTLFVIRSADRGETWSAPIHVASGEGHEFEEPTGLLLRDGRILLLLRDNITRILHATISADGGFTWSSAAPTAITAYPGHLLRLADGRIACVAGRREPPFGIVLHLSEDEGATWSDPIAVRDDFSDADLGYPAVAQRADGSLLVLYYGRDSAGVTTIQQSVVRL